MRVINYHTDRVCSLYLTNDGKTFFVSSVDKTVSIWSYESLSLITAFGLKQGGRLMAFSSNQKNLYISEGGDISVRANPLTVDFEIYGPGKNYIAFMGYVKDILRGENPKYRQELDKWCIMPYKINPLHLYAYYNMPNHLKDAFFRDSAFYDTKNGQNPLSLCLDRNFNDCVNTILLGFRKKVYDNPYEISIISRHMVQLNQCGYKSLDSFYKTLFHPSKYSLLPKFCNGTVTLPVVYESDVLAAVPTNFADGNSYSNEGQSIIFLQSAVNVNLIIGSAESIEFLESILNCPNSEIFRSKYIKTLLEEKWEKIRFILVTQGAIYTLFLILLTMYTLEYVNETTMLVPMFIVNSLLLGYEIYQMIVSGKSYLTDM